MLDSTAPIAPPMKVFYMGDDCHWYAGETKDDAIRAYLADADRSSDEFDADDVVELTSSDLDKYVFERETGDRVSGTAELEAMLVRGSRFPCLFAATEY